MEEKLRRAAALAGLTVGLAGMVLVAGRIFDWKPLGFFHPGATPLEAGLGLLLGGIALWLHCQGTRWQLAVCCAALMLACALPGFAGHFFAQDWGSRAWLSFFGLNGTAGARPGEVTRQLSAGLTAAALALLLLSRRPGPNRWTGTLWLTIFVLTIAGGNLCIIMSGSGTDLSDSRQMTGSVAASLVLLGAGLVCARSSAQAVRMLGATTKSGALTRQVLFAAVAAPVIQGALLVLLMGHGYFDLPLSVGIITVACILLGLFAVLSLEAAVNQLDESRRSAEQIGNRLNAQLQEQAARLQETVGIRTLELRAAAETNARLALVAKHTTNAVVITDAAGRIEWVNPAFECLTGYTLREIVGQKPGTLLQGPDTDPAAIAELRRAISKGEHCTVEIVNYTKQGRPYRQLLSIEAVRDSTGRVMNYISLQTDLTELHRKEGHLQELNQRLELAAQSAAVGIWEWEAASRRSTWDARTLAIYGLTPAEFHGTDEDWNCRLHPDDRARAAAMRLAAQTGRGEFAHTFRIVRPDGTGRYIESRAVAQHDLQGRLVRLVGTDRDITAEREAAEQLARLNERLDLALRSSGYGVWELDIATNRLAWSDRMLEIYGVRREDFSDSRESWLRALHPDDLPREQSRFKQVLHGEIPRYETEFRIILPDGTVRNIEAHGFLQCDTRGFPLRLVGLNRDITERRQLEQRLRQVEELSAESSRLAQIGGWEIDLVTSNIAWSGDTWNIHDLEESYQPTLDKALDFYPAEARGTIESALRQVGVTGETMDVEVPLVTAKGRQRWVRVLGRADFAGGKPVRIHGVIQDVTSGHESESTRRQLEAQLFQAQKIDTLGTLAGGIAHDFNNLLTGIIGYQELVVETLEENHPARAFLAEAFAASLRARNLVEQILAFSRQPEGVELNPSDLRPIIVEAQRFLRATIPAQVAIEVDLDETCGWVLADATQIHQVLMNLGSNAAHAMLPQGGQLTISLKPVRLQAGQDATLFGVPEGVYARLSVKDTGHGMDEATQRRIFDPFFTTKKPGGGTGLGLAVVHGIIRAHQGAITVVSKPGEGTTFHIFLPTCNEAGQRITEPSAATTPRGAGELICVVDDEAIVGRFTQLALENLGYRAVAFTSATACLEALRSDAAGCALLLTDQTMPGMQGHELSVAVRQFLPNLPITIMSGYFSRLAPRMLDQIGRVELLGKPFTGHELASAVHRALHPPAD